MIPRVFVISILLRFEIFACTVKEPENSRRANGLSHSYYPWLVLVVVKVFVPVNLVLVLVFGKKIVLVFGNPALVLVLVSGRPVLGKKKFVVGRLGLMLVLGKKTPFVFGNPVLVLVFVLVLGRPVLGNPVFVLVFVLGNPGKPGFRIV